MSSSAFLIRTISRSRCRHGNGKFSSPLCSSFQSCNYNYNYNKHRSAPPVLSVHRLFHPRHGHGLDLPSSSSVVSVDHDDDNEGYDGVDVTTRSRTTMCAIVASGPGPSGYQLVNDHPIPSLSLVTRNTTNHDGIGVNVGTGAGATNDVDIDVVEDDHDEEEVIIIKPTAVGICASDAKMYGGSDFYWGKNGRVSNPVIPGHEIAGRVHAVYYNDKSNKNKNSNDNDRVKVGQLVVIEQAASCGRCWFCQRGYRHKCDELKIYGQGIDGGMAEYMRVSSNSSKWHVIPDYVPDIHASFLEPLSVGIHAVDQAHSALCVGMSMSHEHKHEHKQATSMTLNENVHGRGRGSDSINDQSEQNSNQALAVVSGCGSIGLSVISSLKYAYGDRVKVIALDFDEQKLALADKTGADVVIQPPTGSNSNGNVQKLAMDVASLSPSSNGGCDAYFGCAGVPMSITQGLECLRKMGTLVHVGIWHGGEVNTGCNWNVISAQKELCVVGSSLGGPTQTKTWQRAIEMIEMGAMPMDDIVSHSLPLDQFHEAHLMATKGSCDKGRSVIKCVMDLTTR